MSVEAVKQYLKKWNKDTSSQIGYSQSASLLDEVKELKESSATVELAAKALKVIPARIAKTLSFKIQDNQCVLIVTAGDVRIDNKKFKEQFKTKAKMLTSEEVITYTGHPVGGVCPFAIQNEAVSIYLDKSLMRFDTIFPAAGSDNSAVEMTCQELYICSGAKGWINICKD